MLNKKEIISIAIVAIAISIAIGLFNTWSNLKWIFLTMTLVILLNIFAKKIIAWYLDSEIEVEIFKARRYWFKPHHKLKKGVPLGAILPFVFSFFSYGTFTWLASLTFEVKPKIYRAAKRHGIYAYSDFTEFQIGLIAAVGIAINLIAAVAGYLFGFNMFAKFNIWFAFFNMIPFSNIDGNKIFFGNLVIWSFLGSIVLLGLAFMFLLI